MVPKVLKKLVSSESAQAFLVILFVLVIAYSIPLITHRSQNPIYQRTNLSSQIKTGLLSGQSTIDPNDGFTSQALGHAAAKSWLSGHVPYWNYYEGVGQPLAGGMQSAALLPLTLVQYFSKGLVYFHFLLGLTAGFATYLLLRKLKICFAIAVLGGLLFELNGAFAWLTNAAFNPIAFLPLLLLGIEYAISATKEHKKGGWILIALALSLSLYAGFPETATIDSIFVYGWAVFRILCIKKDLRKTYIYKVLIGSVAGLLLASPIIITFLSYLPYATTGGHASGGYANIGLPISTLPALFMPYIFGPIFGYVNSGKPVDLFLFWSNVGGYITVPILLFGLVGLFSKRPKGLKLYLSLFSLVLILRIYDFKPVSWLVNLIPGMSQVALYRYSIPALSLALIILAMFGLETVAKKHISRQKIIVLVTGITVFVGLLALYSRGLLHQLHTYPGHRWWAVASVCLGLSVLPVIVLTFTKLKIRLAGIAIIIFANSFILFALPLLSIPKMSAVDYAPVSYLQKNLGLNRFYTLGPIAPNYGSYFNIASINVNDLPVSKNWANYIQHNLDTNSVPIIFTGYTRANPSGPTALAEFQQNLTNYEDVGVKYLVTSPNQLTSSYENQVGLQLVFSDYLVDIFELPNTVKYYYNPTDKCSFTNQSWGSTTANCTNGATVIRHELYIPGWSATVNGSKAPIKPSNVIFQQIKLPKGKSVVKFTYNPPHLLLAYLAFTAGVIAVLAQTVIYVKQRSTKITGSSYQKRLK